MTPLVVDPILAPALSQGSPLPEESVWLANYTSARSRATYSAALADFCKTLEITSSAGLYQVGPAQVIVWREQMVRRGASPRTIRGRLAALSSLFKHLAEKQVVAMNPVTGVKRPRVERSQVKAHCLSGRQVRRMLSMVEGNDLTALRDRALLCLYFYCGCRLSEAINLRVRDFQPSRLDEPSLRLTVKGGKEKELYIADVLADVLEQYLAQAGHGCFPERRLIQPIRRYENDHDGLTSRQAGRIFKAYAGLSELPTNVTPHSARTTFITAALEAGAPIENVQESVGHADISTTRLYDKRRFKPEQSASRIVHY